MKQKYTISRSDDNTSITITEYSEVDKEIFARLCAETFLIADLPDSLADRPESLLGTFRTRNMFPPTDYAVRIAKSLLQLLADDEQRIIEVKIDDKAEISERRMAAEKLAEDEEQRALAGGELDVILESDSSAAATSKNQTTEK